VRTCTVCNKAKPLTEFFRDRSKKHGYQARCKPCKARKFREWRKANPEYNRNRYWSNRDYERQRHLVRKYGVTFDDYGRMLRAQLGCCAICHRPEPERRMLDVDHDHETGRVRGLLCTSCNRVLGHAGDSAQQLRAAADYLDRSASERVA
jgi:hypothetical protein